MCFLWPCSSASQSLGRNRDFCVRNIVVSTTVQTAVVIVGLIPSLEVVVIVDIVSPIYIYKIYGLITLDSGGGCLDPSVSPEEVTTSC